MAKRSRPEASKSAPTKAARTAPPASAASSQASKKKARFSNTAAPVDRVKAAHKAPKAVKVPKVAAAPEAPRTFIVSAGSYERLLYGLECTLVASSTPSPGLPYELTIAPVFSFPAHLSSLRTVSASLLASPGTGSERKVGGKYLVSGGTDEVIKVWDLKRKKEVGSLEGEAAGTITCLRFVSQRNMLLAASTDAIVIYRVRDWVLLRSLKGHKGRVNSIDAHPAGRVALSVGQDKMLRMWDLVAGKAVATMKVGEEGDVVRWNTDGTKFAVICASTLTVYGIDMVVHHTLTAPSRFHDVRFCYLPLDAADPSQREYMLVACEDGKTRIFDVTTKEGAQPVDDEDERPILEPFAQLAGHTNRVKMMDLLEVACPTSTTTEPSSTIIVTTVSSDGKINLHDLSLLTSLASAKHLPGTDPVDIPPVGSYDTDASRLTCVCAIGTVNQAVEEEEEEEEDDEGSSEEEASESEEEDEEEQENEEEEEEEEDMEYE